MKAYIEIIGSLWVIIFMQKSRKKLLCQQPLEKEIEGGVDRY